MKTITGSFTNENGTPVSNGKLFLTLTSPTSASGTQLATQPPVKIKLDVNGTIPANTKIWFSDEFPQLTVYSLSVQEAGGGLVYGAEYFMFVGQDPLDVSKMLPSLMVFA